MLYTVRIKQQKKKAREINHIGTPFRSPRPGPGQTDRTEKRAATTKEKPEPNQKTRPDYTPPKKQVSMNPPLLYLCPASLSPAFHLQETSPSPQYLPAPVEVRFGFFFHSID
jgi:hypothetical protein